MYCHIILIILIVGAFLWAWYTRCQEAWQIAMAQKQILIDQGPPYDCSHGEKHGPSSADASSLQKLQWLVHDTRTVDCYHWRQVVDNDPVIHRGELLFLMLRHIADWFTEQAYVTEALILVFIVALVWVYVNQRQQRTRRQMPYWYYMPSDQCIKHE